MNKRALVVVEVLEHIQRQLTTARLVGKIAVDIGSCEVGKMFRHAVSTVNYSKTASDPLGIDSEIQLALTNYPTLSAVDIIAQLDSLSPDQLRVLADFENSHRKRRTVLFKIDQVLSTKRSHQT